MPKNSYSKSIKGKGKARQADVQPEEELLPASDITMMSPTKRPGLRQRLNPLPFLRRKGGARDEKRQHDINTEQGEQQGDHLDMEAEVEEQILPGPDLPAASSVRQFDLQQRTDPNMEALIDGDNSLDEVMFVPRDERRYARDWEPLLSDIDKRLLETSDDGNALREWEYLQAVARMREDQTEDRGERCNVHGGRDPAVAWTEGNR